MSRWGLSSGYALVPCSRSCTQVGFSEVPEYMFSEVRAGGTICTMRIISLNVGLPSAQCYEGREVITGGTKKPVPRAVLRFGNFDGDRQADRVNHGGLRRLCASTPSTITHTGGDS